MVAFQVVGKDAPRVEGVEKATGAATYAADFSLPGTIWGKALHSPYPHARILHIDISRAAQLPGVHAVITGQDVKGALYGRAIRDIPVLAQDRVRFFGERVAAVAAVDRDTAQQALDLIEVEYEELPAVFSVEEAIRGDAPILHPDFASYQGGAELESPSNAYNHTTNVRGDIEQGFAAADLIVENSFETPRVHHVYLEPQTVLVSLDGDKVLVWTVSKAPYATREALAKAANVPAEDIVFHHSYIGGDFGGKATPADLPIAYYLAKATGRPVKMVLDYLEEFMAANPRHSTVVRLRTGVKRDGTITAHHAQFYVNCGAYAGYKPGRTIGGANQTAGAYRIENLLIESSHVYSNVVPGGHMRAPGYPQAIFALESHVDEVARSIGMDPLEFRLKNLVDEGEQTGSGLHLQNIRVKETLRAAAEAANYGQPKAKFVGRGMAVGDHPPGGGQGTAEVRLGADGGITMATPIFDQGTGTYTTLCQIVAEEFGVPLDRVELEVWDTDVIEMDSGIGGSRGTRVATAVGHAAAQEAQKSLFAIASQRLEWPADQIAVQGDILRQTATGESYDWARLLTEAGTDAVGRAKVQEGGEPTVTSFAAQVAEVSVDPETGEVQVLKFTTAHDVGRIMNPTGHQGQINGGMIMGLGFALMEELRIEDGRVTSLSFGDYKVPTLGDIPPLETVLLESDTGLGPYQARGIGENSIAPVAPAIANAVADAIGVRIKDLPITAEKVYKALREKAG
jgi:CO/xanthine dehydrogenase Mo-binding subunit